ncbi:MAG: hypothetical protein K6G60_03815 [Lachnospiraceae bacterium]|nr:hypothetical protein [Lachnospiraceae bacterium]
MKKRFSKALRVIVALSAIISITTIAGTKTAYAMGPAATYTILDGDGGSGSSDSPTPPDESDVLRDEFFSRIMDYVDYINSAGGAAIGACYDNLDSNTHHYGNPFR